MRIWDLPPAVLCRQHLLGEHRELHALFKIIKEGRKGYAHHPETLRWVGKLPALNARHERLVREMKKRGYAHHSPLPACKGKARQYSFLVSPAEQRRLLRKKGCNCAV